MVKSPRFSTKTLYLHRSRKSRLRTRSWAVGITALSIISALRFQLASGSLRLVLSPAVGHPVAGASSRRCALRGEAA